MTVTLAWTLFPPAPAPSQASLLEDAIRAWVLRASGLAEDVVYFSHQQVRRGETVPRIIIEIGDWIPAGSPELAHTYDSAAPNGSEIEYTTKGPGTVVVHLQAFSPTTCGPGLTASFLLKKCRAKLELPSFRDPLNAAGIGILDAGTITRLPHVVSGEWEDGAFLDVRCAITESETEKTGYIETVIVDPTVTET